MQFEFKTPKDETLKIMSDVASGKVENTDFEDECEKRVCELTNAEYAKITSSGNNSIFVALSSVKGDVIIPDQGGWHGFKQIAKFLNKNIITLKTDLGLINPNELDELDISDNSCLIYTSFAGYAAEQDTKSIFKYCKNNGIATIQDASAGIGDEKEFWAIANIQTLLLHQQASLNLSMSEAEDSLPQMMKISSRNHPCH